MDYTLKRSKRKTISLEITPELTVLVRAPLHMPQSAVDRFVFSHEKWIKEHLERRRQQLAAHPWPSEEDLAALKSRAAAEIPPLVEYYARRMGLSPAGIRITQARTRFGSCSAKNRLCFSCRLAQYPAAAVEYVVVHELAHMVHKNHGKEFHALVASVLPDHRQRRALLRG